MFFIPCDKWKVFFNRRAFAFFDASDLKEVRILFFISSALAIP